MSMEKRNYKNELIHRSLKDKATRLMVNKIFIENVKKIKNFRDYYCIFICKCGIMGKKKPRDILGDKGKGGSGLFCPRCTEQNRNLKMNYINKIDNKILYDCLRWWLVKIGKKYTNRKKWSKEDILNICSIEYERNGMKVLIPKNLDSLPGISLYNTYIRQYKKDENYQEEFKLSVRGNQNQKTPCYPDIYICEHLGLVNERKEYLKNNFPCETDTFEELCELHIRPFLDKYLENITINGYLLDMNTFTNNNRCDIRSGLKKYDKNINQVRQYFKLSTRNLESLRKDINGYYFNRNSKAEVVFDNFLVLYTRLTNDNVEWELQYPSDFIEKYGKKCKSDCSITFGDKKIIIEIWNYNPNNKPTGNQGERYHDYIKWRKIKEDYWRDKEDIIFIGIDHDKLYTGQNVMTSLINCKKILSPYIDVLDIPNNIYNTCIFPKNEYDLMLEKCRISFKNNGNRLYLDKLDKKLQKKTINKFYGNNNNGMYELRKKLHEEINDYLWETNYPYGKKSLKYITEQKNKIKDIYDSKSEEGKKLISKKISDARNNFSEEKKEEIRKKQQKTIKEKGLNKGEKNNMYGKKGKDNPNFGKKYPPEDYKEKYCPLVCEFLQSLDKGDKISGSCKKWLYFSKSKKIASNPWNNPSEYNPWKETRWIGFIESGIEYANENNVVLPEFKYKNVVSTEKKYKIYTEEDIWKAHIDCINNYNGDKITKLYSNNYFKNNYKNLPNITTLTDKNNERNNKIYSSTYDEFLIRTYKFAKDNSINVKSIKYGKKIYN